MNAFMSDPAFWLMFALAAGMTWWIIRQPQPPANEPAWVRDARLRVEQKAYVPRWARWLVATACMLWILGLLFFFMAFDHNPRQPNPATGHIHEVNNHGSVVYVTTREYWQINGTQIGGFMLFVGTFIINQRLRRRREKTLK